MHSQTITLRSLPTGGSLKITKIDDALPIARRLSELGFVRGAVIDKLYVGLFGSPVAVRVGGSVIAVRSDDAAAIMGDIADDERCTRKAVTS